LNVLEFVAVEIYFFIGKKAAVENLNLTDFENLNSVSNN
jgi:hypothetical protein